MQASVPEIIAALCLLGALIHTFMSSTFRSLASRFRQGSVAENFFHLLGEVEVVFGLWAALMLILFIPFMELKGALNYLETRRFHEPIFVFVVMALCASRPILASSSGLMQAVSRLIPLKRSESLYLSLLILGPLLGSFITEPAAMTVTALLLKDLFFSQQVSSRFKYVSLGVLFVNVSVGGVLTPYAAPPVLVVVAKWNWDFTFMMEHFGWKAILICLINSIGAWVVLRKDLSGLSSSISRSREKEVPLWISMVHLAFLVALVLGHDRPVIVMGIFLFFLGVVAVTEEYQTELKLKEALLVGFFLAGLVVLGGLQSWWLQPLLASLGPAATFLGATALTAVTDNAAITYLGSQIPDMSLGFQYALVAGAVAGGGLTVIANAPNPAGFSILQSSFGEKGIEHVKLFLYALLPTGVAIVVFWLGSEAAKL